MSTSGPEDTPPPSELQGLDPKDLLQAGLETVPPVTLPPQSADPDATIAVARPQSTQPAAQVELPLPEDLTQLLPAGAYHVESFLGQGGMGAVYKGMQVRLKRPVAIKIMRRDMGKDYDFEARFEREAQAMAKLNHPNIVSVIDFGEAGPDYLYIVMELIDGADLMDVIRGGQMTQEMALSLLPQICDALQFAHDHGIVHRDIKPSNIMLTRDGRIKMADFGLAKHFDAESSFRTQTGTGMGTPDYAAPEQFSPDTPIDHRADIYALGVMIYQMITGQLPRGVWKPPSQRAEVAPQWDDIVSRAMQSDPKDRYQQASEVKTDVSSIPLGKGSADTPVRPSATGGTAANNEDADKSARAPVKSRAPLLVGIAATAAVIAVGAFFALRGGGDGKTAAPPTVAKSPAQTTAVKTPATPNAPPPATSAPAKTAKSPPIAAPALPESGWRPLVSQTEWQKYSKATNDYQGQQVTALREYEDGLLHMSRVSLYGSQPFLDGAIRAHLIMRAGSEGGGVSARNFSNQRYFFHLEGQGAVMVLAIKTPDSQLGKTLGSYRLPKPLQLDEKFTIELRIQGDQLTGLFNGQEVVRTTDQRVKEPGTWGIDATDAWFESVEVQPLPAAATPAPIAATALPESGWKPLVTDAVWRAASPDREFADGLLHIKRNTTGSGIIMPQSTADAAIRARIRIRNGTSGPMIQLRQVTDKGRYMVGLYRPADGAYHVSLLRRTEGGKQEALGTYPLPQPPREGDTLALELRAQEDRLTVLVDGIVRIEANDKAIREAGNWGIQANEAWFESVEVQPLPAAASEPWENMLSDPAKLRFVREIKRTADGMLLNEGSAAFPAIGSRSQRDGAVRLRAIFSIGLNAAIRVRTSGGPSYQLSLSNENVVILLRNIDYGQTQNLASFRSNKPLNLGQEYELELRFVGQNLTAKLDGEVLGTVTDSNLKEGSFGIAADGSGAPVLVKAFDFLDLDKSAASASPSLPVSKSSDPKFPPGQWVKLFTKPEDLPADLRKPGSVLAWEDGWIRFDRNASGRPRIDLPSGVPGVTNYAIRVRGIRSKDEISQTAIVLRKHKTKFQQYQLSPKGVFLTINRRDEEEYPEIMRFSKPIVQSGAEYVMEFGIVGSQLVARYNDDFMRVQDTTFKQGSAYLSGKDDLRDIEVINLDGLPEAEALRLLGVDEKGNDLRGKSAAAETWENLLSDPKKLQLGDNPGAKITAEGLQMAGKGTVWFGQPTNRNGAVKIVTSMSSQTGGLTIRGRMTADVSRIDSKFYSVALLTENEAVISLTDNAAKTVPVRRLFPISPPLRSGQEFELEVRIVGDRLTAKLNGKLLGELTDSTLQSGRFAVASGLDNPPLIKSLEYLNLDSSANASSFPSLPVSSSLSSVTKEAPFTNTLGMKFVPVPITGGPTDKQRVLFSVWETRVQDYAVFVKEMKMAARPVDFQQGADHPVVNVRHAEAVEFCAWLTARDRQSGAIGPAEAYRLPSDHEWSCAVGIGDQEDAASPPSAKNWKLQAFPWVGDHPPPAGAGNYYGAETKLNPAVKEPSSLVSFDDKFPRTAPVGSFTAHASGLHDLGGNVWEWCGDEFEPGKPEKRVLRGASWAFQFRNDLLSSARYDVAADYWNTDVGFRVVLASEKLTP